MSSFRLALDSLLHHWRLNLAVALGVIAGTAVLTGALLVGDSMRGSLLHLTLERLGRVDEALIVDKFFRAELADEVAAEPEFSKNFETIAPVLLIQGTVAQPDSGRRANRVTVLGGDERFWKLGSHPPGKLPGERQVWLNRPLADELGVKVGDEIIIRLPAPSDIPRDSPLGRKTETVKNTARHTVTAIIPADGLGRFGLQPNQQTPLNAYLDRESLAELLEQPGKANGLLVAGRNPHEPPGRAAEANLQKLLHPRLTDYNLSLVQTKRGYFQLTSERMLLEPAIESAALKSLAAENPQPVLTYLANYITAGNAGKEKDGLGEAKIPYSTIAALDFRAEKPLGPFKTPEGAVIGALSDDEIVINAWAFEDIAKQGVQLSPGDKVRITYFEPESTHNKVLEKTADFKFKAVAAMNEAADDRELTPELKGVTDEASIADWNPPFPYYPERVRNKPPHDEDEKYWNERKATPKAFVSLAAGRRLWSSRFGNTTSLRIAPTEGITVEQLREKLQLDPAAMGFTFRPIKRQGIQAATGTTPFSLLFLGFSMFLIAAALLLVALLFKLGIEQRARELGIMLAVGLRQRQVRGLLLTEGLCVSAIGGAIGVLAGLGYAWLMVTGLRTWWVAAVTTPFLQLYITPASLVIGYVSGVLASLATIAWTLRQTRKVPVRRLLAGQMDDVGSLVRARPKWSRIVAVVSLVLAAGLGAAAFGLSGEAQAGAFFGAGGLVLVGSLALLRAQLASGRTGPLVTTGGWPIARLALRNGARHPGRSALTMGLVASASFLIVAISAFHLDPPDTLENKNSGTGGFTLVAESDQPIYQDLSSDAGRAELGFSTADTKKLAGTEIFALRVQNGDDASCLNLYQPQQPRVFGASEPFIRHGGFAWAGTAATTSEEKENPWLLLNRPLPKTDDGHEVVPMILDQATAMYSLHLSGVGARYSMTDGRGGKLELQVVGLLSSSILQGTLIIDERIFLQHFPDVSGYRFFLIDVAPDKRTELETALENTLSDFGFDTQLTKVRLEGFLAVQNTYLSTFQSLGALGLLLGTFGLAAVQLRNVLERRGELALLRAAGFRRAMLARMVMWENAALLIGGLLVGCLAALVAILPHIVSGGAAIPWPSLGGTLSTVLVVGLLAGLFAVRAVLTTPLLPALRGD